MNTNIKNLIVISTALICFACTGLEDGLEGTDVKGVDVTITAMREGFDPDTKTVLESDGSVEWCPLDEISVFYGDGSNGGSKFTSQNTEQAAIAEFKGRLEGISAGGENFTQGKYLYGVYPYSVDTKFNNGIVTISLPSYQTATEGSFSNGLFPTIARAQSFNLAFYNICGGVKFTVSRDDITSVTFKGNNGERLAGTANVVFDSQEKPAVLDDEIESKNENITLLNCFSLFGFGTLSIILIPILFIMNHFVGLYGMIWVQLVIELIVLPIVIIMYRRVLKQIKV